MELISSIRNGNINRIEKLLHTNIDVNFQNNVGHSPLTLAAMFRKTEIVKLLLAQPNINVNIRSSAGFTPLMIACSRYSAQPEIVKMLLQDPNIDVNLQSNAGYTALMLACGENFNQPEITEMLLSHPDTDVNLQSNSGFTALIFACSQGFTQPEIAEMLLYIPETDVNIQDVFRKTALNYACENNSVIVELILQYRLFIIPHEFLDILFLNYDRLLHKHQMYDPNLTQGIMDYFPNMLNLDLAPKECIEQFIIQEFE